MSRYAAAMPGGIVMVVLMGGLLLWWLIIAEGSSTVGLLFIVGSVTGLAVFPAGGMAATRKADTRAIDE